MKTKFNKFSPCLHIGIIFLLGIASYINSLDVPLQVDDRLTIRVSISLNNDLYSLQGFMRKARWFADLTFAMNRRLHGEQVLGYHLVNLAIHLSAAGVIYLFVQRSIEALKQSFRVQEHDDCGIFLQHFIPFMTAALFVCHPVQTQAVTYISQRYTSLATLLYLSSLLTYVLARLYSADAAKKAHVWSWGSACFLLAILAMKSKEIAFTLPLMMLVLECALFRGQLLKNRLYLASCAVMLLFIPLQMFYTQGYAVSENVFHQINAATTETVTISRSDYLLTQFRVVATYLRLLIVPINQNWDYDYPVYHSLSDPAVLAALLLHITLAGTAVALFIHSQRRLTSGSPVAGILMRIASLGICWLYLALSVESSLIPIRDVIFEHRIYLPSVGFFLAVTAGIAGIAASRQHSLTGLWTAMALLCLIFTATTVARNRIWSDEITLWQDVVEKSPDKARSRQALGALYLKRNMTEKAIVHFVRGVELDPGWDISWRNVNLAISAMDIYRGRGTSGIQYFATDLLINPLYRTPWSAISFNNLGLAYEYLGNQYLARENFQKAVTVNPSLDMAWYNLLLTAAHQGDMSTVELSLKKLKTLNPLLEQAAAKELGR